MKKTNFLCCATALVLMLSFGLTACGGGTNEPEPPEKTSAILNTDQYTFYKDSGTDLSIDIVFNDAVFTGLLIGSETVSAESYVKYGADLTISYEYLAAFEEGSYTFKVCTDLNDLSFEVSVFENHPLTVDDLLSDGAANVTVSNGNRQFEISDADYAVLRAHRTPLEEGKSFQEEFSASFAENWLYPFTSSDYQPDFQEARARFELVEDPRGVEDHGMAVKLSGAKAGEEQYSSNTYDYIEFRGVNFTQGATYSVEVTYTVITPGAPFSLCFYKTSNVIAGLTGETEGEVKTAQGTFIADTAVGYNVNAKAYLLLSFGGGNTGNEILINSISVTRMISAPEVRNLSLNGTGSGDYIPVNTQLSLDYEMEEKSLGDFTSAQTISWYAATDASCGDKRLLKSGDASSAGSKTYTVTAADKGQIIYAEVVASILKNGSVISTDVYTASSNKYAIAEAAHSYVDLTENGNVFTETFEDRSAAQILTVAPSEGPQAVNTYIADNADSISGNSLFVEIFGTTVYSGLYMGGLTFQKNASYNIEFDVKFIGAVPDVLEFKLRPGRDWYNDIACSVSLNLNECVTGEVYTMSFRNVQVGDFTNYELLLTNYGNATTIVIDNVRLETVSGGENVISSSFTETFETPTLTYINMYGSHVSLAENGPIDGSACLYVSSGNDTGEVGSGVKFDNYVLLANTRYRIEFDLYVTSETTMQGEFYVRLTDQNDWDKNYVTWPESNGWGTNGPETIHISAEVSTGDNTNYKLIIFFLWLNYDFYLDNLTIAVAE